MLAKYTIAGVAGSVLLASIAFAQSPTATTDKMKAGTASDTSATSSSFQGNWRASKMVGLNVYNDNNESVGSINDMLTDKTGSVKAVVIGFGGFLGVGEHLVAVPFDKVKFVSESVASASAASSPAGNTRPPGASSPSTTGAANTMPAPKANPWYPDHAVYNATKDELKAMPEFKYSAN
jgi:sporulation protein YlmC with PRC-barrel domain